MKACNGIVNKIETFGSVDGPGVRFVVFLQGCNMRCKYCQNPETWARESKEAKIYTPQELVDFAWRYYTYWGKNMSNGGITVSGGEPLIQIDFLIEFFRLAKQKGIHTAIDTSGEPFSENEEFLNKFDALMAVTDLFLVDIKAFDNELHRSLTGYGNENILKMIKYLSKNGKKMWVRRVLVPELTDGEDLKKTKNFIDSISEIEKVEVLPYHTLGLFKWKNLGINYPLSNYRTPTSQELAAAKNLFK